MPGWPTHLLQSPATLLVLLAPLPFALALVEKLRDQSHGYVERMLGVITLAMSLQIALGLVLGFAGVFALTPLLVTEALLAAAGVAFLAKTGMGSWRLPRPLSTIEASILLLVITAGVLGFIDVLVQPTRNFDSLAYHLPVMAHWVSTESLSTFKDLGQVAFYPSHFELMSTMATLPLRQDLLISLPNLLAWLQLGLVVRLLARRFGANADAASVAAGLLLLMPAILSRLDAIQPDIMVAAVFLTAIAFLLRDIEGRSSFDAVVVLMSVALLPGLKLSGPLFILMLVPIAIIGPQLRWIGVAGIRERVFGLRGFPLLGSILWLVAAAFIALAWYVRNWVELGNPLGDLELSPLGMTIFEGSISRETLQRGALSNVFEIANNSDWSVLGDVMWTWLSWPAVALALGLLLALAKRHDKSVPTRGMFAVVALMLATCVLYWNTPYSGDNGSNSWTVTPWMQVGLRYGFPALALFAVLGGVGLSRFRFLPAIGLAVLVASTTRTMLMELLPRTTALIIVVVVALSIASICLRFNPAKWRRVHSIGAVALLIITAVVGLGFTRDIREDSRERRFGTIAAAIDEHLDSHDVVASINTQRLHLGSGGDWRSRVVVPKLPKQGAERVWLRELRASGVTAILLGSTEPSGGDVATYRRVRDFIRDSGNFELLHDYETLAKDLALFRLSPRR